MSNKWIVKTRDKVPQYTMVLDDSTSTNFYNINMATKFDTKEEAESWANAHQEVIEVESED